MRKPKVAFLFFISCHFVLLYLSPNECPGLCRENFEVFCWNFFSSTNPEIGRSNSIPKYFIRK